MKKRYKIAAGVIGGLILGLTAAILAARWAIAYKEPCAKACQDLGAVVAQAPKDPRDKPVYRPTCQPLELKLELFRAEAKTNTRHTLWYRATLRNVSCLMIGGLFADDFVERRTSFCGSHLDCPGLSLMAWGPDGRELEALGPATSSNIFRNNSTEYGEVIPYQSDYDAYKQARKGLPFTYESDLFALYPDQSFTTVPSILEPYTLEDLDVVTQRGRGTMVVRRPARFTGEPAPAPPPGFRILDQFVFKTPGVYRIRAVYGGTISAIHLYPYEEHVPDWLAWVMRQLRDVFGLDTFPPKEKNGRWGKYISRTVSPAVEFTVTR
ncbi:MAG: hypothetical protein AABZ63_04370 [Actinomycetota bacterium]